MGRKVKGTPNSTRKKYMLRSSVSCDRVLRSRSREKTKMMESSSSRKTMLRSLVSCDRVLRSRSREKTKVMETSSNGSAFFSSGKKERKKKKVKVEVDENSRCRRRLTYLLRKMNYQQSLIAAYSGEGWKGLSMEKLKPEKELERATSEILEGKLKIRNLFQHIDSLCAAGHLPGSLFDSEGQISSEDIFCAKCASKDVTPGNDIILCDGNCDRAFHQFCLVPPLLKEDIPPGDEGWLCPECDCKVDCIAILNGSQGTNFSISDGWEMVFPEAVSFGQTPIGNCKWLSDSFVDDDDDDGPSHQVLDLKARGNELGFVKLEVTPDNKDQYLCFPSDDSEDGDYDPVAPELDHNVKKESSGSDFTSDSEDLSMVPLNNGGDSNQRHRVDLKRQQQSLNNVLSVPEPDPGDEGNQLVLGKRNIPRLDYKRLYEETYRNISSDSNDDEDYVETTSHRKRRKRANAPPVLEHANNGLSKDRVAALEHVGAHVADDIMGEQGQGGLTLPKFKLQDANLVATTAPQCLSPMSKTASSSASNKLGDTVTQDAIEVIQEQLMCDNEVINEYIISDEIQQIKCDINDQIIKIRDLKETMQILTRRVEEVCAGRQISVPFNHPLHNHDNKK